VVSPLNISKQLEDAYRRAQAQLGITIHPNHLEMSNGSRVPILRSSFAWDATSKNPDKFMLSLDHPNETGAWHNTEIHNLNGRTTATHIYFVGDTQDKPSQVLTGHDYQGPEHLHEIIKDITARGERLVKDRGGRDAVYRDEKIVGNYGRMRRENAKDVSGQFDKYGRFTEYS
jgi:hypothetical protein